MNNQSEVSIRKSLNRAAGAIIAAYIAVLFLMIGGSFYLRHNQFLDRTELLTNASRNMILVGDYRQAITLFSPAFHQSTITTELFSPAGVLLFSIPSQIEDRNWLDQSISIPITSSFDKAEESSYLVFHRSYAYDPAGPLAIWISLLLFALPIFHRIRSKIETRHSEILELRTTKSMAELVTQVAHDIRSPLSALKIVSSLQLDSNSKEAKVLRSSANRIEQIAEDLLQKHRNTAVPRSKNLDNENVNISDIVREVLEEKQILHFNSNISIQLESDSIVHATTSAPHAVQLRRVLSNIISNAVDAIAEKSSEDQLVLVKISEDKNSFRVSISDNGVGIEPQILSKIGRKYGFSTRKHRRLDTTGNGVGLYHAFATVENMGGKLTIDSKLGHGTDVQITLPARSPIPG